ncbi:hypothetical protein MMC12_003360 [Toensbergia leucococca]|nr:hypothetical protein [Toensbergia leucococca]
MPSGTESVLARCAARKAASQPQPRPEVMSHPVKSATSRYDEAMERIAASCAARRSAREARQQGNPPVRTMLRKSNLPSVTKSSSVKTSIADRPSARASTLPAAAAVLPRQQVPLVVRPGAPTKFQVIEHVNPSAQLTYSEQVMARLEARKGRQQGLGQSSAPTSVKPNVVESKVPVVPCPVGRRPTSPQSLSTPSAPRATRYHDVDAVPIFYSGSFVKSQEPSALKGILKKPVGAQPRVSKSVNWGGWEMKVVSRWIED